MQVLGGLGTSVPCHKVVVLHTAYKQVAYGLELVKLGGLVYRRADGYKYNAYDYIQRQKYNSYEYEKLVIRAFFVFQGYHLNTK